MCWKVIDGKYISRKRDVWRVPTKPLKEAHFATYPHYIIKPCLLAGCPVGGVVIDPFMGAGTTALVARELKKRQQVIVACRLFFDCLPGETCTCRFENLYLSFWRL